MADPDPLTELAAYAGWFEGESMRGGGARPGEQQYFEGNTKLIEALSAVMDLHDPVTAPLPFCDECGFTWPCPTVAAINKAVAP